MKQVKRNNHIVLFAISILLLIVNCSEKKIDEDTAIRIYVENIILEEKYSYNLDSLKINQKKLYEKYNTSREEFENYLKNLKTDIEKWQNFFKKANTYLQDLKNTNVIN
ncbi:hypothetical protein [Rosettibacter firmus]|uniref:hypothetical protein n=1 Tax=Rosettibacter firmus TaxID=3111522 RepID=UPI00336BBADA